MDAAIRAQIEHVLDEWRETMKGEPKAEAVVRGIALEIRAVLNGAA